MRYDKRTMGNAVMAILTYCEELVNNSLDENITEIQEAINTASGLIDIVSSLESDAVFYNRMIAENQEIAESILNEIKQLEEINESRKQYIENNQADALIRRGLADICFQYEDAERKIQKLASELSGINRSNTRALKRLDAIQKALYQGKRLVMQFIG